MAVYFDPELEIDWQGFFQTQASQTGHGYYEGYSPYQRGRGFGSVLKGIFRFLAPITKSAVKSVGKQAVRTGLDVAGDVLAGKHINRALEDHALEAGRQLVKKGKRAVNKRKKQTGKGIKKRQKRGGVARKKHIQLGVAAKDIFHK